MKFLWWSKRSDQQAESRAQVRGEHGARARGASAQADEIARNKRVADQLRRKAKGG